jgi:hypothetical protein
MFAVPFDPGQLDIEGAPAPILEDVAAMVTEAGGQFDFSPASAWGPAEYHGGGEYWPQSGPTILKPKLAMALMMLSGG